VFGAKMILDSTSLMLQIRLGEVSVAAPRLDEAQGEYRRAMAALPTLAEQGDGMKSFFGLLLPIITATYPIVIVDEPEAFLHPPQAFALGRALALQSQENDVQVLLATHDKNLLAGLLDVDVPVSVVRLDRQDDRTTAHQLQSERLRSLWSDPILRYGNVLDGLFHRGVVIAEAERDCRFYSASLEQYLLRHGNEISASDILFVPSNGLSGIPEIVRTLRAAHVPVVACPDMDVIRDKPLLQRLVSEFGGDWSAMEKDWKIATQSFVNSTAGATSGDILDAVRGILEEDRSAPWTRDLKKRVNAQMRDKGNPWGAPKHYGLRGFPRGESTNAAIRLSGCLAEIGIVVVRVGELEGFGPDVEVPKGKNWLRAALDMNKHTSSDAFDHIAEIMTALYRQISA
jgi:hypothetical protein